MSPHKIPLNPKSLGSPELFHALNLTHASTVNWLKLLSPVAGLFRAGTAMLALVDCPRNPAERPNLGAGPGWLRRLVELPWNPFPELSKEIFPPCSSNR